MKSVPFLFVPILLSVGAAAHAQTPPDAGSLLQQIEKNQQPALPKRANPEVPPPPSMDKLGTATVTVSRFRLVGNRLIDEATLQRSLAPFQDRPLGFQDLQRAAQAVSEAYRAAGWIARAYLPQQEIDGGVVTIQVVEAVFGGARHTGQAPARVSMARIQGTIDAAQATGLPLNADALDRALLLIDDLPGVSATGNLAAGERDNETIAVLKLEDEPWVYGSVGADNGGSRSTGAWQLMANVVASSPLKLADLASLNLMHAEGSDYARLAYGLPVGYSGLRLGVSASWLGYRLVTDEFAALDARGNSTTSGVDLSLPLVRSRFKNLFATLNYDDKQYDNRANGAVTSQYRVGGWTAALAGNLFDNLGGGGASTASLAVQLGRVDLGGSPSEASDAATVRSAGSFTKLRYGFSRQQAVTETVSLFGALSGQSASKNLDSSEKFYLGGSNGVRAYPASEGGGSDGQMLNLEMRARLPGNFSATGFFDWGHVTVNHDNNFSGAATHNGYALQGLGVAVGWSSQQGVSLKATLAHRVGSNPNANVNGSDQDGSLTKTRLWLSATLAF